jgi:hypothetical protein
MSSDRLYKLAGPGLLVGAVLSLVTLLYGDLAFEGFRPSHSGDTLWAWVNILSLVGGILVILGFTGAYARQSGQAGAVGLWGWVLTTSAGMLFSVGFTAVYMLAVPLLSADDKKIFDLGSSAQPAAALALFFIVATLLFTLGTILFGLATTRAGVFPTWTGWALIVSGVLTVVATVVRLAQPTVNPTVADVPFLLFFVTLGAIGYQLGMRNPAPATAPASAAT